MKVLKFGGTSISSCESIHRVLNILKQVALEDYPLVIVVSAFQGVTNKLDSVIKAVSNGDNNYLSIFNEILNIHSQIASSVFNKRELALLKEEILPLNKERKGFVAKLHLKGFLSQRSRDYILAFGERFSATIITHFLNVKGFPVEFLDARKLIVTNKSYGKAKVKQKLTMKNIVGYFENNGGTKVVTGFIAATLDGVTTTLGRGGSDYSAAIFGTALNAECIVKWTDVDGIMTADPKIVKNPFSLNNITFGELFRMSKFNSRVVVHPKAIYPLVKKNIPLLIKNTFNSDFQGTFVSNLNKNNLKIISVLEDCCLLKLNIRNPTLLKILKMLKKKLDLFFSIDVAKNDWKYYILSNHDLITLLAALGDSKNSLSNSTTNVEIIDKNISLVTLISSSLKIEKELKTIKSVLRTNKIDLLACKRFSLSLSIILRSVYTHKAVNILHESLYNKFSHCDWETGNYKC